MSEAAPEQPPVQNNGDNNGPGSGGVTGNGFRPGQSGNPGGRPKGIARRVRELVGEDGDALVLLWTQAAVTGYVLVEEPDTDPPVRTYERVTPAERATFSKLLAERGFGKPPQFAPVEDGDPLELSEQRASELAEQLDRRMDELAARRAQREAQERASASGS